MWLAKDWEKDIIRREEQLSQEQEEEPDQVDGIYMEKPKQLPLNQNPGILAGKLWKGIDSRQDIFDKTAVFHVKK